MKKVLLIVSFFITALLLQNAALAGGGGNKNLDEMYINMNDKASLRNGAKLFMNYCLSCHSAGYSRYNRVAEDLGFTEASMRENLMFTTEKFGDLMQTSMSEDDAKKWLGVVPPDLTLVSRVRGPDWVYTYLRSFYRDDKAPSGWNNSLFPNVAMPHVMYDLQGTPELVSLPTDDHGHDDHAHGHEQKVDESLYVAGKAVFDVSNRGELSNAEFDNEMRDLTNFLVYLAEPAALKRVGMGVWTIAFLIIFMLLAIVLKKEYWRDIH